MTREIFVGLALATIAGCAADPGTRPSDMSASNHDRTASALDRQAAASPPAEAKKDRSVAAEHREASRELVDAEAKACADVAPPEQDACPFRRDGQVVEVKEYYSVLGRDHDMRRVIGASIVVPPTDTRSEASVNRVVSCNLARNAVRGGPAPEASECPLGVHGTKAEVHRTDRGIEVTVHTDDEKDAAEVLRRARALVAR